MTVNNVEMMVGNVEMTLGNVEMTLGNVEIRVGNVEMTVANEEITDGGVEITTAGAYRKARGRVSEGTEARIGRHGSTYRKTRAAKRNQEGYGCSEYHRFASFPRCSAP